MKPELHEFFDNDALNGAATLLMECLPEHLTELVGEIAADYQLPVWQVFCGIVLEAHMKGTLSGFQLEPAWSEGLKQTVYICKTCSNSFTPRYVAQQFCSNECGVNYKAKEEKLDNVKPIEPTNDVALSSTSIPDTTPTTNSIIARLSKQRKDTPRDEWADVTTGTDGAPEVAV